MYGELCNTDIVIFKTNNFKHLQQLLVRSDEWLSPPTFFFQYFSLKCLKKWFQRAVVHTVPGHCCDKLSLSVRFVFRRWVHSRLLLMEAKHFGNEKCIWSPLMKLHSWLIQRRSALLTPPISPSRETKTEREGWSKRRAWVKESFISLVFIHSTYCWCQVRAYIQKLLRCLEKHLFLASSMSSGCHTAV